MKTSTSLVSYSWGCSHTRAHNSGTCEYATELVYLGLIAMMAEAGADLFNRTCFKYPTLGDLLVRDLCGDADFI